jgi:hypothetical protein
MALKWYEYALPWRVGEAAGRAATEWVFDLDPQTGQIEGTSDTRRTPREVSIFDANAQSPMERIASRFGVKVLPVDATREEHAGWLAVWRANAMISLVPLKAIYKIESESTATARGAAQAEKLITEDASTWESILGAVRAPYQVFGKLGRKPFAQFIVYAFDALEAGWGAHIAGNPEQLIANGAFTARELERDYMVRLACYQAIFELITNPRTVKIWFPDAEEDSAQGLGNFVITPTIAAIIVAAIAIVVVGFVLLVLGIFSVVAFNKVMSQQIDKCHEQFKATGKESKLCLSFPGYMAEFAKKPPGEAWGDQLKLYAVVGGVAFLGIMFMPEIVRSVREARRESRPQEVRMATNRRRRRRR